MRKWLEWSPGANGSFSGTAKLHTKILRFGSLSQKDLIYCAWTF